MRFFDIMMPLVSLGSDEPDKTGDIFCRDFILDRFCSSLAVTPSVLAHSVDCGSYRPSTNEELFQKIIDKITQEMSDKVIRDMIAKPEGQLGWNDICMTTTSSSKTSDFSLDRLKETMKELRHTFTGKPLGSLELRASPFMGQRKQFRFPKTKKKRIRRKWAKREQNYRFVPDPNYIIIGGSLYAHPVTLEKLKAAIVAAGGSYEPEYLKPCV